MEDAEDDATSGISVEKATEQYLDSVEAGNSRKNFQSALARWRTWLEDERGVTILDDLKVLNCRRYARHLKRRARDGELKDRDRDHLLRVCPCIPLLLCGR